MTSEMGYSKLFEPLTRAGFHWKIYELLSGRYIGAVFHPMGWRSMEWYTEPKRLGNSSVLWEFDLVPIQPKKIKKVVYLIRDRGMEWVGSNCNKSTCLASCEVEFIEGVFAKEEVK